MRSSLSHPRNTLITSSNGSLIAAAVASCRSIILWHSCLSSHGTTWLVRGTTYHIPASPQPCDHHLLSSGSPHAKKETTPRRRMWLLSTGPHLCAVPRPRDAWPLVEPFQLIAASTQVDTRALCPRGALPIDTTYRRPASGPARRRPRTVAHMP